MSRAGHKRVFFLFLLIGLLAFITLVWSRSEPRYHGRTLTTWLEDRDGAAMAGSQGQAEAQQAVLAMPRKRVLACLLEFAQAHDSPIKSWLREKGIEHHWPLLQWRSAEDHQLLAMSGFEVLGTNAVPAVGELTELLDDPEHAYVAALCLDRIRQGTEPAFCMGLTNRDANVRELSIYALASVMPRDDEYLDRIKRSLNDSSESVRVAAVGAIGAQTQAPELAVPLLLSALQDPDDGVAATAAGSLAQFATNALPAFRALQNLAEHGGNHSACAALTTLVAIAPRQSVPILTNAVTRGGLIAIRALTELTSIEPEMAAPLLLTEAVSSDSQLRRKALLLLCKYPVKTPEMQTVLNNAISGPDPGLSLALKRLLTEQYLQTHPTENPFAGEPSYAGKTLGQWLDMHDHENNFMPDVTNAIRAMGTNAIPALFKRLVYCLPPFNLPAFETNLIASGGFIVLGSNAIPAIPQLETLMDTSSESRFALFAMISTAGTGSNAIPVFIKGLTNRFDEVRSEALNALGSDFGNQYPEQRRAAVPFIINMLQETNADTRMNASNAFKIIDPEAATRAGIK